jgi:hypothetical protein
MFHGQAYSLRGNQGFREKWQFYKKLWKKLLGEGKKE